MDWKEIDRLLAAYDRSSGPFALATLVRAQGSSYRQPGSRMLITEDQMYEGFISAGCLEEELVSAGIRVIQNGEPILVTMDLRLRYGCPGAIDVLLERIVKPNSYFEILRRTREIRRPAIAVTEYHPERMGTYVLEERTHTCREEPYRVLEYCNAGVLNSSTPIQHDSNTSGFCDITKLSTKHGGTLIQEMNPPIRLVIMGNMPDTASLCRIGECLGWEVMVVSQPSLIPTGDRFSSCVIMSHHLGTDIEATRIALENDFSYVGVMGSTKRQREIKNTLLEIGVSLDQIKKLYGPVGLDIGSESPSEIALAIAAEIQAVMKGRSGGLLRNNAIALHGKNEKIAC